MTPSAARGAYCGPDARGRFDFSSKLTRRSSDDVEVRNEVPAGNARFEVRGRTGRQRFAAAALEFLF
jgi:hypothetical protein